MTTGILLGQNGNETIPEGIIVAWSGSKDNIPQDWVLCDGTNGTPDLRDRFILGAGTNYNYGDKGGNEEISLTIEQLPKHTHSFFSGIRTYQTTSGGNRWLNTFTNENASDSVIGNTGNNSPINILPPYYSLCYICYKKGLMQS